MKKILLGVVTIVILFVCCLLTLNKENSVSDVNVISKESKIYSKDEIDSAIGVAIEYFKKNFNGCSLIKIGYVGDEKNKDYLDWAKRNNKEVIVLISSFKVGPSGGDGSLNPNSKYKGWNWILVRNKGGKWEHVDHGY